MGALQAKTGHGLADIEEILKRKIIVFFLDMAELGHFPQPAGYLIGIRTEVYRVHTVFAERRQTVTAEHLTDFIETDFLLEIIWICHSFLVS